MNTLNFDNNITDTHRTFDLLTADELAEHAFNVYLSQGRHPLGARLIYRALELSPSHSLALRCLFDLLNQDGMQVFSAITLEYALLYADHDTIEELHAFEELLFMAKWSWGFSHHCSGKKDLHPKDFKNRHDFNHNELQYNDFIHKILQNNLLLVSDTQNNLMAAFACAKTLCGIMAQFLVNKDQQKTTQFNSIFNPDSFIKTDSYKDWLNSYEPALDEIIAQRLAAEFNKNHNTTA